MTTFYSCIQSSGRLASGWATWFVNSDFNTEPPGCPKWWSHLKFTLTGPRMLAETLVNHHYPDVPALALAIVGVLAEQVQHLAVCVQRSVSA